MHHKNSSTAYIHLYNNSGNTRRFGLENMEHKRASKALKSPQRELREWNIQVAD